jgi:RNA polymerase sigma-70 factor, ECF subfamily
MSEADLYKEFHQRLLNNDPIAPAQLAESVLQPLIEKLRRKYPGLADQQMADDAATDAILNYVKEPAKYDPTKKALFGYLFMSANRDLLNYLAKKKRLTKKEISLESVEDAVSDGNYSREREPVINQDEKKEFLENVEKIVNEPVDKAMVKLMFKGEKSTEVFAKLLEIENLSIEKQRHEVKRHKDRLMKKLERYRKKKYGFKK